MSGDAERRLARRSQLLGVAFLVVAVLGGGLIAFGAFGGEDPAKNASVTDGVRGVEETTALLRGVPQHGIVLGRPDAPVTIVEFADLKCPACRSYALGQQPQVVRDLVRTGKANVELRLLGLESFRPDTLLGRNAAYALAGQDRMWPFVELVYYNQGDERDRWISEPRLRAIARPSPELRGATISTAATPGARALSDAADRLADRLDVEATPTFFVRPRGRDDYRKVDSGSFGGLAGKLARAVADASASSR